MSNSFLTSTTINTFLNVNINDKGVHAANDISFWIPALPLNTTWFYLGYYATNNYISPPSGSLKVYMANSDDPNNPCFMPPISFTKIWTCTGNGAPANLGIYSPQPPNGYVAIGSIAIPDFTNPPLVSQFPGLMCVRQDLAQQVTVTTAGNLVWTDDDSGADDDVTVYKLPNSFCCSAVSGYPATSQVYDVISS